MEGIDMIKPEFVLTDHERVLILNHVSDADKTKLEGDGNAPSETKGRSKKLKGQNKNRFRFRVPDEKQLCCRVIQNGEVRESTCTFKNCRFLHSVEDYLKVKEPDLGDTCHVFNTKGKCLWGVACRFGSSHLGENGKNLENAGIMSQYEQNKALHTLNKITYTQQIALRKREFDFSRAEAVIKAVDKIFKKDTEMGDKSGEVDENGIKRTREDDDGNIEAPTKKSKDEHGEEIKKSPSRNTEPNGDCEPGDCGLEKIKTIGPVDDADIVKLRPSEKKRIEWKNLLYLAPLTTVGNLPFRRICKEYGADVTCSEMVMATTLLRGEAKEWSLVRRHGSEDLYGVQIAGSNPYVLAKASQALRETCDVDFIDINLGCPLDAVYKQGIGCGMLMRQRLLKHTATSLNTLLDIPFTYKVRSGCKDPMVHKYMPWLKHSGVSLVVIHGRTREQRYTRNADWDYVNDCAKKAFPVPVFGNGDILSYQDYQSCLENHPDVSGAMIGRGALMKPWIFQEIKEKRMLDPSSSERFDMLKRYVNYGLEHWGSDNRGVENTRLFLLEWLSFLYRYVPVGILTNPPQVMNQRLPFYKGRDDLETLMGSPNAQDWVKLSEMLLGPAPDGFVFLPKHKSNAWK